MRAIKMGLCAVLSSLAWPSLAFAEAPAVLAATSGGRGTADPAISSATSSEPPGPAALDTVALETLASVDPAQPGSTSVYGTPTGTVPASAVSDTGPGYQNPGYLRQGHMAGFMGWSFAVPIGSVTNHTANVSPVGFELQFNGWVTSFLSLGVSGEWASYVDNRAPATVAVNDHTDVHAKAYNWMSTSGVHFLVHYFFRDRGSVLPYIGPHVGMSWTTFQTDAADLVDSDTQFSVNFGGEGGVMVPFGPYAPVMLFNLRYQDAPAAQFRRTVTNVQSLSLLIGIGF